MRASAILPLVCLFSTPALATASQSCGVELEKERNFLMQAKVSNCVGYPPSVPVYGSFMFDDGNVSEPVLTMDTSGDRPTFVDELKVINTNRLIQYLPRFFQDATDLVGETNMKGIGDAVGGAMVLMVFNFTGGQLYTLGNNTIPLPDSPDNYNNTIYGCKGGFGEPFVNRVLGQDNAYCTLQMRYFALQCANGEYVTPREGYCRKAEPGSYADGASVVRCDVGTFTLKEGKSACDECAPGFFQSERGQTGCSSCVSGSYQDLSAQGSCKLCGACGERQYRSGCEQSSEGECRPCEENDSCPPGTDYAIVGGAAAGAVALVLLIAGPLYYRRRQRILRELAAKEAAIRDLEAERTLEGNLGLNANPMMKVTEETKELERLNGEQADKISAMGQDLLRMKKSNQEKQSDVSTTAQKTGGRSNRRKKEFTSTNVVPK